MSEILTAQNVCLHGPLRIDLLGKLSLLVNTFIIPLLIRLLKTFYRTKIQTTRDLCPASLLVSYDITARVDFYCK